MRHAKISVLGSSLLLLFIAIACAPPPPALPQLHERTLMGPGDYRYPHWSRDGRYLALKEGIDDHLVVYDLQTQRSRQVVSTSMSRGYLAWTPTGQLSYLQYRPDLSGSPVPEVNELHVIEPDGLGDRIVGRNLYYAGHYVWLNDGQRVVVQMTDREGHGLDRDIYLLNVATGLREKLVTRRELNIDEIGVMAMSADETTLVVYGSRGGPPPNPYEFSFVLFDLVNQRVVKEFDVNKAPYETPTVANYAGLDTYAINLVKRDKQLWLISALRIATGECARTALYFWNLDDSTKNFCIATTSSIQQAVVLPDMSKVAYLDWTGGLDSYLKVADLTPEILNRMGQ